MQRTRVNHLIRITPIRLIGAENEQIGVVETSEAMRMAQEAGLDLVEIVADSRPPVCKIMDYGKFKYEENRAAKKAKKNQHQMQLKEVKMRPKIEDHDYNFKLKHAREFLDNRDKVKFTVTFRGREMAHQELGYKIIQQVIADLGEVANIESPPRSEGRTISMVLSPKATKPAGKPAPAPGANAAPSTEAGA